jgi:Spy/CpxP family protein refolding chaperone
MLIRLLLAGLLAAGVALAQDEGGGAGGMGGGMGGAGRGGGGMGEGGMGGGGMGGGGMGMARSTVSKLDQMATWCTLSKDQKKQFKTILDAGSKETEGLRKQIAQSKTAVEAAIVGGQSPDEIKKLVDADSLLNSQMTQEEYKAFSELFKILDADQKKLGAQNVLRAMSGIFMTKNWDQ